MNLCEKYLLSSLVIPLKIMAEAESLKAPLGSKDRDTRNDWSLQFPCSLDVTTLGFTLLLTGILFELIRQSPVCDVAFSCSAKKTFPKPTNLGKSKRFVAYTRVISISWQIKSRFKFAVMQKKEIVLNGVKENIIIINVMKWNAVFYNFV